MRAGVVHAVLWLATFGSSGCDESNALASIPVFESWGRMLRWNRAEGAIVVEVRRLVLMTQIELTLAPVFLAVACWFRRGVRMSSGSGR